MTVRLASKPGQRQAGGEIGLSETCPVSTKQERKAPIIQFYYLLFSIQFWFWSPQSLPERLSCLIHKRKKKIKRKKERERRKLPVVQGWGEGKRVVLLKSEAVKLKEP